MRKVIAWLCLLSVLTAGGYTGYRRWTRLQPLSVRTVAVISGPITLTIAATGTVKPTTTVAVGCEVSGAISELAVDYNDRVIKDQVIARINPEIFEAELQQAEADVAAAQASEELADVRLREAARPASRHASRYPWSTARSRASAKPSLRISHIARTGRFRQKSRDRSFLMICR